MHKQPHVRLHQIVGLVALYLAGTQTVIDNQSAAFNCASGMKYEELVEVIDTAIYQLPP